MYDAKKLKLAGGHSFLQVQESVSNEETLSQAPEEGNVTFHIKVRATYDGCGLNRPLSSDHLHSCFADIRHIRYYIGLKVN